MVEKSEEGCWILDAGCSTINGEKSGMTEERKRAILPASPSASAFVQITAGQDAVPRQPVDRIKT
jgi:hypothetical protein